MPEQSKCRSCQAPVLFIPSAKTGNFMILDAWPTPAGNIALIDGQAHVISKGDLLEQLEPGPRYLDHHATCPEAAKWKRKRTKQ